MNEWPQERIARVLRELGEERRAGSIAREIVRRRPIETTRELVAAIKAAIPPAERFGRGHPAKRTFQAIRIAVNGELDALDRALPLAWDLLRGRRPPGRDLLPLARGPARQALPRRPRPRLHLPARAPGLRLRARARGRAADQARAGPDPEEIERNPRAASAHLRAARKLRDEPGETLMGAAAAPSGRPALRPGEARAQAEGTGAAHRAARSAAPRSRRRARPKAHDGRPHRVRPAALAGAALIPQAVRRRRGPRPSDSSLIVRLTRGRSWIAVLCVLLGGIVALNVVSLSLNAALGASAGDRRPERAPRSGRAPRWPAGWRRRAALGSPSRPDGVRLHVTLRDERLRGLAARRPGRRP